MNAAQLFLLGRKLMRIAEEVLPQGKVTTSLRLVVIDIAYHPDSSITEITERTAFPQSLVSMTVAKLRDLGLVETAPDPADRRRTLVRTTPRMVQRGEQRGSSPIEAVLAKHLGPEHDDELAEVLAALEVLARLLTPEVTPAGTPSPTGGREESLSGRPAPLTAASR